MGWDVNKFVDDTAGRQVYYVLRELYRLEKWPGKYLRKFNKGKCQVLHLERYNPVSSWELTG